MNNILEKINWGNETFELRRKLHELLLQRLRLIFKLKITKRLYTLLICKTLTETTYKKKYETVKVWN